MLLGKPLTDSHWPGKTVTSYRSYLTTGGPGKELRTSKLPPTGRILERSKEERGTSSYVLQTSQNSPCWNPSWLSYSFTATKTLSRVSWPETTQKLTISIKPEIASHVLLASSGFLYCPALCLGTPPHNVSCFVRKKLSQLYYSLYHYMINFILLSFLQE